MNGRKIVNGVGVLFWTRRSSRSLYLLRGDREGSWCLPGGKVERGESLVEALRRECEEEIGWWDHHAKLYPIECYTTPDGRFQYHTFFCPIDVEFVPTLNHEHVGFAWCDQDHYPRPLHGGLWNTVRESHVREKIAVILESIGEGDRNHPPPLR